MVVPFFAQYAFPSQANKSVKMTPRIPYANNLIVGLKTDSSLLLVMLSDWSFQHKDMVRYKLIIVNPLTTSLSFDVSVVVPNPGIPLADAGRAVTIRFQNNVSFYN